MMWGRKPLTYQGCSAAMPVRQKQADNRSLHLIDCSSRTAHASAGLATSTMVTRVHGSARAVDALKWRICWIKIDELCVTKGF